MRILQAYILSFLCLGLSSAASAQSLSAPQAQGATVIGTVLDVNNGTIPGASVVVEGPPTTAVEQRVANDNGFFEIDHLSPGVPYHIVVHADGFTPWTSPAFSLRPGQYMELTGIHLNLAGVVTTVTATVPTEEIAREQELVEEKQRVLGFIPNFYTVYDQHPAPLTARLKFRLALKTSTDPVTFVGAAFIAGIDHAADTPDYGQGAKAFGQRFGANYANGLTDIMIGGAILPSVLHQDPRYYYQGTGTTRSRLMHALSASLICRGDNGRLQPNFSSLGGFLASGAISNVYYPDSDRGVGQVFSTFGVDVAANMANGVIQEFFLKRLTPSTKNRP